MKRTLWRCRLVLGLAAALVATPPVYAQAGRDNTFSIVARDPATGALGAAVSTARLAVGNRVLLVEHQVGAVASQANTNPVLARDAIKRLQAGSTPAQALESALQEDPRREERQLSIIDASGRQAAFTGTKPDDYKGHLIGKDVVAAGNILVGRDTLEAMVAAFETGTGTLADRIMAALEAGQRAGGDRRGKVSAALVVVNQPAGPNAYAKNIDLRIDSSKDPVTELRVLYDAYKAAFKIE